MRKLPSREHLLDWLDYDRETGIFRWRKEPRPNNPLIGQIAGHIDLEGYRLIRVGRFGLIGAHCVAWIYIHGQAVGSAEIDHMDGDRSNNAIGNLRLASRSLNRANSKRPSNNTSGYKGVSFERGKWRGKITVNGRQISLGRFRLAEEAHAAYVAAAMRYFGEFARAA